MKKTNKIKVEEFLRVDHAGERGAIKIYEGQLLALNTFVKDDNLKKTIQEMKDQEKEHCNYFENEIKIRNIKPTKLMPLFCNVLAASKPAIPAPIITTSGLVTSLPSAIRGANTDAVIAFNKKRRCCCNFWPIFKRLF